MFFGARMIDGGTSAEELTGDDYEGLLDSVEMALFLQHFRAGQKTARNDIVISNRQRDRNPTVRKTIDKAGETLHREHARTGGFKIMGAGVSNCLITAWTKMRCKTRTREEYLVEVAADCTQMKHITEERRSRHVERSALTTLVAETERMM